MSDIVGSIPEFTTDESVEMGTEEVKQPVADEVTEEKETPELPAETVGETDKPASQGEDTVQTEIPPELLKKEVERATQGLRNELVEMRRELATARGNDRKIIQQSIVTTEQKLDELADVNPADVALIEKVLQTKGYIKKEDAIKMTYEQVQKQTLDSFLNENPEYKPENDPNDVNWKALQRELTVYRMPDDPTKIKDILMRAHKAIKPQSVGAPNIPVKKRSLQTASVGAGGVQRASSNKSLPPEYRRQLQDGGWSEEDIAAMESSLE